VANIVMMTGEWSFPQAAFSASAPTAPVIKTQMQFQEKEAEI